MCVNVNARRAEKIGSELLRYPLNSSIYLLWCTCFVCWFRDIVEIARVRGEFFKTELGERSFSTTHAGGEFFDAHLPSGDSLRHRRERVSLHADSPRPRDTRQEVADTALRSSRTL